jgi:hypothetical protein
MLLKSFKTLVNSNIFFYMHFKYIIFNIYYSFNPVAFKKTQNEYLFNKI